MCEETHALLNAYLDGELRGWRLRELEGHLESCAVCRNELKELQTVSNLLRSAPTPTFLPAGKFAARLTLQLPRRSLRDPLPKPPSWTWWLVPAGLLGAWFFLRTVFTLATAITAADATGLLGQSSAWFNGSQPQALWYLAVNSLFGSQVSAAQQSTLSLFNQVNTFGGDLLEGFLWQAMIVLLYWVWLAVWWLHRAPRPLELTAAG